MIGRNIKIQFQQSDTQNEKENERAPEGNKTDDDSQHNDMQWETRYESFINIIFLDLFTVLFIYRNHFLFFW